MFLWIYVFMFIDALVSHYYRGNANLLNDKKFNNISGLCPVIRR